MFPAIWELSQHAWVSMKLYLKQEVLETQKWFTHIKNKREKKKCKVKEHEKLRK